MDTKKKKTTNQAKPKKAKSAKVSKPTKTVKKSSAPKKTPAKKQIETENLPSSLPQWDTSLFDNYEKKILDLKNLVKISGLINSELNMAEMTQSLLYSCQGMVLVSSVTLFILKSIISSTYAYGASVGIPQEEFADEFPEDDPLVKELLEKKKTIWISNENNSEEVNASVQRLASLEPELVIPMLYKDKLTGFLVVGEKLTGDKFTSSEVEFMFNMANLAAIAIENLRLFEMATRDRMTNLFVHHYFQNRLEEEIARSLRTENHRLALLMFDIDHFKAVNDTWGHQAGDIVIKEIAGIIRNSLRKLDLPARYGGEEFAVILPDADAEHSLLVAERIRKAVEDESFDIGEGRELKVTISAGSSDLALALEQSEEQVQKNGKPFETQIREILVSQADIALYHSKNTGRNRSSCFQSGMKH